MATGTSANVERVVLLMWALVAFFYFYLSYDYIRFGMADRQFEDYLNYVVQLAGVDHRPPKDIRALLLVKSQELGLPLRGEDVNITSNNGILSVGVSYNVDIDLPLLQRQIYTKTFDHKATFHQR